MVYTPKYTTVPGFPLIATVCFISIMFNSCVAPKYYLCITYEPLPVYKEKSERDLSFTIPVGKQLIVEARKSKFRKIRYGKSAGYITKPSFDNEWVYSSSELSYLVFNNDSTYTDARRPSYRPTSVIPGNSSSNSSSSSGGQVNVKGYYRKDGTYVRPHTRSAPSRRH